MSPFSWQCQNLCLLSLAFIIDGRVVKLIKTYRHLLSRTRLRSFTGFFFGRFSATVTNSSWRNLEFFKKKILEFFRKFLEFFWKFLEFIQKNGIFFPKFPEFCQSQALKLKFGQIFVQNISTSGLSWAKSQFLVGKLLSFWMICLSFSKICLSFFSAWVFLALSFFRNVQKKAWFNLNNASGKVRV